VFYRNIGLVCYEPHSSQGNNRNQAFDAIYWESKAYTNDLLLGFFEHLTIWRA